MTNNTKSLDEQIVEHQEQVFRKPTQDYDSLSGCGNESDLFWGGYALGEYDTHLDNKKLIDALIADRARLLAEVDTLRNDFISVTNQCLDMTQELVELRTYIRESNKGRMNFITENTSPLTECPICKGPFPCPSCKTELFTAEFKSNKGE